jgi:hypothetical protein
MGMANEEQMVTVSLGGESRRVSKSKAMDVADELHNKYGGAPQIVEDGVPDAVTDINDNPYMNDLKKQIDDGGNKRTLVVKKPVGADRDTSEGEMSWEGKLRSLMDKAAAEEAGFAPAQTVYERGRLVKSIGVENATRGRVEHKKKPTVKEYCESFIKQIETEDREDMIVTSTDLRMQPNGMIYCPKDKSVELALAAPAFGSFLARSKITGGDYLKRCWPELRAHNVNEWLAFMEEMGVVDDDDVELGPVELKMRTRKNGNLIGTDREVFGVVSPGYQDYDVDIIAEALAKAAPKDARGTVTYDGYRARFEVMFHSNVKPKDYVAGEFFKSGVIIGTDDTGKGGIIGNAAVWQNLCLNLIVIDTQEQNLFRIKHVGDVDEIAEKFEVGFVACLKKIEYFMTAWGYAVHEKLTDSGKVVAIDEDQEIPIKLSDLMPGIFSGIMERELVPVRARKEEAVPKLMQMWEKDTSAAAGPTRAAVVNAFTRYAHEVQQPTPWLEDDIQRAAGQLLYGKRKSDGSRTSPAPLPFEEFVPA